MTSLPASRSDSQGFNRLDERIQRWIWSEGWTTLRDAQEQAIPALIEADQDVIIAAATAAGKTEAAFFPILTNILKNEPDIGSVLYISPLKALINDQWGRLSALCESLEIPVVGWHGDVASNRKHAFLREPKGILLITPESLEALFVNRGTSISGLMENLRYIVVDELHAFIGSERGKQLQSLMHRTEKSVGRSIPRVGLSATLGDMKMAAQYLRPNAGENVAIIESKSGGQELKILLKGYLDSAPKIDPNPELEEIVQGSVIEISSHLYKALRGSNNLVFPNSRRLVELYADLLTRNCERDRVPNEFWAHHGSLSKEYREDAERALKQGTNPATAICTTTLELGIDIGSVRSICQIGSPQSVSSLRQRLGRSGRRKGEPAILRSYSIEPELNSKSGISDNLREGLVQSIAMIRLLIAGWFEPPRVKGIHGSTMIQQILSIIAEKGGENARGLWDSLAARGCPFEGITSEDFLQLLKRMGELDLLVQDSAGTLLHGELGEKFVNHYEFYAAFTSEEEFRLVCDGRTLGSLPVSRPLLANQRIIFAGKRWRVVDVDAQKKLIVVVSDRGGAPPAFDGSGALVHDRVREEMQVVLTGNEDVPFLDESAQLLLSEARSYFRLTGMCNRQIFEQGSEVSILSWRGDLVNDALALLLAQYGLSANNEGLVVSIKSASKDMAMDALEEIAEMEDMDPVVLLKDAKNILREKWDWVMHESLARRSFASLCLDFSGARDLARILMSNEKS